MPKAQREAAIYDPVPVDANEVVAAVDEQPQREKLPVDRIDPYHPVFRMSLDEIRREPMITVVIETPVYIDGDDKATFVGEKPVKINERKVTLKAVDITAIPTLVSRDGVSYDSNPEVFWEKCRAQLARLLRLRTEQVSQRYLNWLSGEAANLVEPQKKSDSESSGS